MQDLTPGQSISQRFVLIRQLAQENQLPVWLASVDGGPQQALLRFFPDMTPAAVTAELQSEIQRAGRVVHPSLVRCLGLFEHGETALLAHEFVVDGRSFGAEGQDYRRVLPELLPVAEALAYLHDLGLAHGAVSERFLRVDASGRVCLDGLAVAWIGARGVPRPRDDMSAFGDMLYCLSGAQAGTPLPENLASLLQSMQSDSESVRDMHEVVRRLARVLNVNARDESRAAPLEGVSGGAIAPRARSNNKQEAYTPQRPARPGIPMKLALPALLLMLFAVVYVVFFLPHPEVQQVVVAETSTGPTNPGATASATPQAGTKNEDVAPFAAAANARVRQDAQDAAMSLLRSLVALEERGVSQWAPEEFATARLAGDEGDALYRNQGFAAALTRYKEGLQLAELLIGRSGAVLQAAVADGDASLAAGNAELARQKFALALAVDKENPAALAGAARAQKLDDALEKMQLAKAAEQAGNYKVALDYYRAAVAIDAAYQPASDALRRVQSQLGAYNFQDLMSRGFRALDGGDTAAAQRIFEQAAKLRPDAPGPRDALAQVQARLRDSDIATRRAVATEAESEEDWSKAVATYQSILQTDNTLVFAKDGLTRSQQRAMLAERMQRYIDEPLRMFDNQAYNEARAALAQARTVATSGPTLTRQIEELGVLVEVARSPVVVKLQSDGMTRVSIYKIGEIGKFQEQSVGLIPGRYTAVGSRQGYRDVRREFDIRAGKAPPPVTIICEDPV